MERITEETDEAFRTRLRLANDLEEKPVRKALGDTAAELVNVVLRDSPEVRSMLRDVVRDFTTP